MNTLLIPPAAEPVTLAEANAWLKADGDDALVSSLIATARQAAEDFTGRAFVTQTWKLSLDATCGRRLPDSLPAGRYQLPYNYFSDRMPLFVGLPRRPVQSVVGVNTYAADGTPSAYSPAGYRLSGDSLVFTAAWPSGLRFPDAADITYVAGYGDPSRVPAVIKTAILMAAQALYAGRATDDMPAGVKTLKAGDSTITRFSPGESGSGVLPAAALALLAPYKTYRL